MSPVYDMGVQKWIGKKLPSSIWSRFTRLGCIFEMLDHCMQPRKGSFEVEDDKGNKYVSLQVKHSLIFSCFELRF
jgi:hypothetical protein